MASNPQLDSKLIENQQVQNITLSVNINDLNIIMAGLQELPHRVVDSLLRNILEQAQSQLQTGN